MISWIFLAGAWVESHARIADVIRQKTSTESAKIQFVEELSKELEHRVKVFHRSIKVYHYGNRGDAIQTDRLPKPTHSSLPKKINDEEVIDLKREGRTDTPVELNPPEAAAYFKAMSGLYRDRSIKWMVGPGLYGAVDPIQSESYAGNPWFLLEITIPRGNRYLDLRPFNSLVVSRQFVKKWFETVEIESIHDDDLVQIDSKWFKLSWIAILNDERLRNLTNRAFQRLKIDEIAYVWGRSSYSICNQRSFHASIAFNFVNPEFLDRGGELKLYVQSLEKNPEPAKITAYRGLLDLIDSAVIRFGMGLQKDGSLSVKTGDLLSIAPIRILTSVWAKTLGRVSPFSPEVNELANYSVEGRWKPEYEPEEALVDLSRFQVLRDPTNANDRQLSFDPLLELKKTNPSEYQTRVKAIEQFTYACSSDPALSDEITPPAMPTQSK